LQYGRIQNPYPEMTILKPMIPILSLYTAIIIAHHGVLDKGVNFIQKPFSAKDRSNKVREVMDSK
jgi:hypothetical protein